MKQNLRPKTTKLSRQRRIHKKTSSRGHYSGFQLKLYRGFVAFFIGIFTLVFCYPLNKLEGDTANASPNIANLHLAWDLNDSQVQEIAKWDVVVLDMENQVANPDQLRKLKQLNPNIKILAYITSQEIRDDALGIMRTKLMSGIKNDWYLYDLQRSKFVHWPGTHMLNMSDICPTVDGQRFNNYLANFVSKEILSTGLWDGVFYDNAWEGLDWFAGGKADLNIDGISEPDVDARWRNGYHTLFDETRRLAGDKYYIVGNLGPGHAQYSTDMSGALIESFPEFGWTNAMKAYRAQESNGTKPKVIIINVNTHNTGNKNDFKLMRFGLASTLMGDGYYSFDYGDQDHNQSWWYDEYNVNLGTPINNAVSFNGQTQFQDNDVWKREYSNGIAIVNPTNQTKDVDLGGDYEKIIGTQDPKVNDGSITDRIKIGAKDGILLLKTFQSVKQAVFKNGSFVRFYRKTGDRARNGFFAFEQGLPGGARIYIGDLNKDGQEDKVVASQGQLQLLGADGNSLWSDYPYGSGFRGELSIAVGNISRFDTPYIVVSSPTQGSVLLYDIIGRKIKEVFPIDKKFKGGLTVAMGNIDADESGEVIVGVGKGKLSEVIVYDGGLSKIKKRFSPYGKYTNGIEVAVGNTQGDAKKEIITMSRAATPVVDTFDANGKKLSEFRAKSVLGSQKLFLTSSDVNNDGVDEIVLMND